MNEPHEEPLLNLARRVIVIKIQAGLADGDDFRLGRPLLAARYTLFAYVFSVVRVHPDGREKARVGFRNSERGLVARKLPSTADDDDFLDAAGARAPRASRKK